MLETERQQKEDEKFNADHANAIFLATEGNKLQKRSFTRSGWAIGISIAALIASAIAIVVTHNDAKPKPFPYDTTEANARLQMMEQRLQAIEKRKSVDTAISVPKSGVEPSSK